MKIQRHILTVLLLASPAALHATDSPQLDHFAEAGVKLNRHRVAPACSPTRVALLTGRYWIRCGCVDALPREPDACETGAGIHPKVPLPGDNPPLFGKKGDVYPGGIRMPDFVCWQGRLEPGVGESPLNITDWMPTLSALAGAKPPLELVRQVRAKLESQADSLPMTPPIPLPSCPATCFLNGLLPNSNFIARNPITTRYITE